MELTFLLLLSMTVIGCQCYSYSELYLKEPVFSNLMCPSEKVDAQTVTNNEIWCARECAEAPGCKSLIYLRGNKTCFRLKSVNPFSASSPLPGAMFYKSDKAQTTILSSSSTSTTTTLTTTTTTASPTTTETTTATTTSSSMTNPGTAVVAGLPDSRFTASSTYSNYDARKAKLNNTASSWIPGIFNQYQLIQVDFGVNVLATHVITKGDPILYYWVGQYRVATSSDCTAYDEVSDSQGYAKIFIGNVDRDTDVTNALEPPVVCRCFLINPISGNGVYIGLRFDVLVHTITPGVPKVAAIPDSQLTASSSAAGYEALFGRLDNTVSCWRPGIIDIDQAIQVDFINQTLATHIVTKGNPANASWVATYRVYTSTDCEFWKVVKDNTGYDKVSKNPSL